MVPWVTLEISHESGLKDSFKIRSVLQGPTDVLQTRADKEQEVSLGMGKESQRL